MDRYRCLKSFMTTDSCNGKKRVIAGKISLDQIVTKMGAEKADDKVKEARDTHNSTKK